MHSDATDVDEKHTDMKLARELNGLHEAPRYTRHAKSDARRLVGGGGDGVGVAAADDGGGGVVATRRSDEWHGTV